MRKQELISVIIGLKPLFVTATTLKDDRVNVNWQFVNLHWQERAWRLGVR